MNDAPICPNCGQWQRPTRFGFLDCYNDCAARGFAPRPAERGGPGIAFTIGDRVNVTTIDGATFTGELRGVDGGLAVVRIGERSERVPVERIKKI